MGPFEQCTGGLTFSCRRLQGFLTQTFTLRLSWTTDGQYLVAPNSFQSPSHCAAVISRGDWACPLTVVGHRAAVTVVRFNPHLFRDASAAADEEPATCFALGSQVSRALDSETRFS